MKNETKYSKANICRLRLIMLMLTDEKAMALIQKSKKAELYLLTREAEYNDSMQSIAIVGNFLAKQF